MGNNFPRVLRLERLNAMRAEGGVSWICRLVVFRNLRRLPEFVKLLANEFVQLVRESLRQKDLAILGQSIDL